MDLDRHIADLEQDLGMTLTTSESERTVHDDEPVAFNGDRVFYADFTHTEHTVMATGFAWEHDGVTIRGQFPKPIEAIRVFTRHGDEFDSERNSKALARAILAKLGPIPCRDEVVLGLAA
ncbi:MAG: hypothetical protein R3D70_06025 [Rhizobiaceae bacterium]